MRRAGTILLSLSGLSMAYDKFPEFDAAREVLEIRCLECHTQDKAKGDLVLTHREALIKGGESGASLKPGSPEESPVLQRVKLSPDDEERMPPKKHGEPLAPEEIAALGKWISAGAPWPEGEILSPKAKTSLPRWDAPADPEIASIEAFPKSVTLETAADFHRVIVIARMKDASTHDITAQSKLTLADASLASLSGTALTPKKDGTTSLRIDYRGLNAEVPVTVKDAEKPRPVSFQLDVMPVLTAAGCNTGSCHGSARGQDGFHLSLYGFDPKGDH
ncbi:MAG: cell surface protein, partial [Verrucomicrobiaceae bacterium]